MAATRILEVLLHFMAAAFFCFAWVHANDHRLEGRLLMFREKKGNSTFECTPSGPCIACQYSEKNDEKYHCSETGYRIPIKCAEIHNGFHESSGTTIQKGRSTLEESYMDSSLPVKKNSISFVTSMRHLRWRRLLDVSSTTKAVEQNYLIFRSCVPAADEERLTVLGFEGIMVCLFLLSSSAIVIKRKRTSSVSGYGAVRLPTSSRF
ncbi:uncharacterized protein LOC105421018 isoform X1 [Amborella trichopoda]|uniref:uncharacterized protein LOC105421018 isoform X1 n=1 Tax=Amborella trichopoda TaxID=13333 RepID=UPI0005D45F62|nr:uncharacterized protein LOC105421018 isoform X1 [Amborella trichopoda]XP_020525824.1 uncharacterized protein LOC105421018 isoform X1 [Amborella trichopoda]|eukprot:XP_011625142.1 uncharacterized protein LOC105421018 isoform X1 [Amborella trichopoda]